MKKVHICFMIDTEHSFDKWFSVYNLFKSCCDDNECKVSILKQEEKVSPTYNNFLSNLNKNIEVYVYNERGKKLDLSRLNIDAIIVINPYYYKYDEWRNKVKIYLKLYGIYCSKAFENEQFLSVQVIKEAHRILCDSKYQKKAFSKVVDDEKKLILSGSINFDYILKDKKDINQNLWRLNRNNKNVKRVIWSPHYAIKTNWVLGTKENLPAGTKNDGFSQFTKYADLWLKIPKMYPNLDIIMKPHPLLFKQLETQTDGEWNQERIAKWKKDFLNNPNTQIMEHGLYGDLFLTSDGIINSSVSFIAEYLPTLKPFLQCINVNGPGYNEFGQEIVDSYYKAYEEKDI
ncbi:hypothetical protein ACFL0U_03895, partial [Pseudomonadota bacterium]